MKKAVCLMLVCLPLLVSAQKNITFSFVSAKTGKPMPHLWFTIRANGYKYIEASASDTNGFCHISLRNYDSTADYQLEVNNQDNAVKPAYFDLNEIKTGREPILKVFDGPKVKPNPCGERMYWGYYPKSIFALTDMPTAIQLKFKQYLLNRTGKRFYNRLQLNLGQEIDLAKYYEVSPNAIRANRDTPPVYSLCMSFTDPVTHAELYSFRVNLTQKGQLIGTIALPDMIHHPKKAHIISQQQAIEIGKQIGLNNADVRFSYQPSDDSIIWCLEHMKEYKPEGGPTTFIIVQINAHTGKVVSKKTVIRSVMY
jgi:hypothetical protein